MLEARFNISNAADNAVEQAKVEAIVLELNHASKGVCRWSCAMPAHFMVRLLGVKSLQQVLPLTHC